MTNERVLLIDDDETLIELLAEHMSSAGYHPLMANGGLEGLHLAAEAIPDLVVLDVMMPGMDGWEVCRRLRESSSVPIIMLTAKGEEYDKLRGFHLGVDDYVTKPFSFAELVARVGAVLSRAAIDISKQVTSNDLTIDFDQRRVTVRGEAIDLTPTEYHLLETLARNANHTLSTESILVEVWGSQYTGETQHVKRYIWTLRKKIETDPGDPRHILTERGFGYRFE
ncbi:MAG: response regulator transcription factor [Candidatus Promineifilaceae bacterium]